MLLFARLRYLPETHEANILDGFGMLFSLGRYFLLS